MELEELKVYNLAMEMGEKIWAIVDGWNYFQKDTVGKQLVRASDSIASNLSEGYGRYHYREKKNFGYYSRGSLYETKTWIVKASNRKLITGTDFQSISSDLLTISKMLNGYIRSIGKSNESDSPEG